MTPDLILAASVAIVTTAAVLLAMYPILRSRERSRIDRLTGRLDELGLFVERMLRVVYGVETREHRREDHHYGAP